MSACLLAPFGDSLIIVSDINQISVDVDHVKLYFEISDRFSQILYALRILDIPMMVGIRQWLCWLLVAHFYL